MHRNVRAFGALIAGLTLTTVAFTGTAAADTTASVDIAVSAAFDKTAYNSDDQVGVDVTVTNVGMDAQTVSGLDEIQTGELALDEASVDLLWQSFDLESGESKVLHLTGTIRDTTADHQVIFSVSFYAYLDDENPADNTATITAPVTQVYGVVDGHVYTDNDHDGSYDPGEGLAGATAKLENYYTLAELASTSTDADGAYRFDQVPTGKYYLTFQSADGWVIRSESDILEVTHLGLTMDATATRPLTDTLRASATFDKLRYKSGATAVVTVKIRNTGDTAIQGVRVVSGGPGMGSDLQPADCGVLDTEAGVDIPAGQAVTATCTGTVSPEAAVLGLVSFERQLGTTTDDSGPWALAGARVGNKLGYADLLVAHDANGNGSADDGEGVAGAKVALVDPDTGQVVARATSDANGNLSVKDIPTGAYRVRVASPWQLAEPANLLLVTTQGACGAICGRWTELVVPRT